MKDEAYLAYVGETSSWLHEGRKELFIKILQRTPLLTKKPEILEIGAGMGQNIKILSKFGVVDVLEINPYAVATLREMSSIRNVIDKHILSPLKNKYDIICAFDVIEHLKDDKASVEWIYSNLKLGGIFIATVPAYQWFFSSHDVSLDHYRRYNSKSFKRLLPNNSRMILDGYFNMILFPFALISRSIWDIKNRFIGGRISEKQKVPQNKIINKIFCSVLKFESLLISVKLRLPFGLTYYICLRKI